MTGFLIKYPRRYLISEVFKMEKIRFDHKEQHFRLNSKEFVIPEYPLTVTLQITRRCNLQCPYCSESEFISDPTLKEIEKMIKNLKGVNRIIISGGEPTLRKDLSIFQISSIIEFSSTF